MGRAPYAIDGEGGGGRRGQGAWAKYFSCRLPPGCCLEIFLEEEEGRSSITYESQDSRIAPNSTGRPQHVPVMA